MANEITEQNQDNPTNNEERNPNDPAGHSSGWSWGAFMFDAAFLIAVRKYMYLLVYLLMLVPVLNLFVYIAFKIYLGVKGHELARDSETFESAAERTGFLKGIDWAGKVMFFVFLAIFALSLILAAFGLADIFSKLDRIEQGIEGNQPRIEAQFNTNTGIDDSVPATQTPATQTPAQ